MVTELAAELKFYSKDLKENMAQVVLDYRKAEFEKVQSLPQQSVPYSTPALEQAAIARQQADAMDRPQQDLAMAARAKATMHTLTSRKHVKPETPKQRYARWVDLDQKVAAG